MTEFVKRQLKKDWNVPNLGIHGTIRYDSSFVGPHPGTVRSGEKRDLIDSAGNKVGSVVELKRKKGRRYGITKIVGEKGPAGRFVSELKKPNDFETFGEYLIIKTS